MDLQGGRGHLLVLGGILTADPRDLRQAAVFAVPLRVRVLIDFLVERTGPALKHLAAP
jgi:hypothetical protein